MGQNRWIIARQFYYFYIPYQKLVSILNAIILKNFTANIPFYDQGDSQYNYNTGGNFIVEQIIINKIPGYSKSTCMCLASN